MNKQKEIQRIEKILKTLPAIKAILKTGGGWNEIKFLCEPLWLSDTAFIENPNINDFLMDENYWKKRLEEVKKQKPKKPRYEKCSPCLEDRIWEFEQEIKLLETNLEDAVERLKQCHREIKRLARTNKIQ